MTAAPRFLEADPEVIATQVVTTVEEFLGRELQPAQVERLYADMMAYREALLRLAVQQAAELNLVNHSHGVFLEELGQLVGVERLPASHALTTMLITLEAAQASAVTVPAGTRIANQGGQLRFATRDDVTIPAGALEAAVTAEALEPGVAGNGYLPGAIANPVDGVPLIGSIANITVSGGGGPAEGDEALRQRIRGATHAFTTAGSAGAWRERTREAHPGIIDVAVIVPDPCEVIIRPLMADGLPSAEVVTAIEEHLSADTVRPLGDLLIVEAPIPVDYAVQAVVTPAAGADATALQDRVETALSAVTQGLASGLSRDVVPAALVAAVMDVDGAYDVDLVQPATTVTAGPGEVALCSTITVTVTGGTDG